MPPWYLIRYTTREEVVGRALILTSLRAIRYVERLPLPRRAGHAETVAPQGRWRERGLIRVEVAGIEPVPTVWNHREPLVPRAKCRLAR